MMQWDGKALIAGPTRVVPCDGSVQLGAWSASGKRFVALVTNRISADELSDALTGRMVTPRPPTLSFITAATGQAANRTLLGPNAGNIVELKWMASEQAVLATYQVLSGGQLGSMDWEVISPSGQAQRVAIAGEPLSVEPHPIRNEIIGVVKVADQGVMIGRWTPDAGWEVLGKVPIAYSTVWTSRSQPDTVYLRQSKPRGTWLAFDLAKRKTTELRESELWELHQTQVPLIARADKRTSKKDLLGPLFEVVLEPGPSEGFGGILTQRLAPQPSEASSSLFLGYAFGDGWVSPKQTMVAMWVPGGVALKPLLSADLKMLEDAKRAAEISRAMSDSKQSVLSILMWSMDNDESIPGAEHFPGSFLPYAKNSDALGRFVFTSTAKGKLSDVKDPANTEVGYIPGPGGRAVAYLDGHVKWIPDPPKK
jgi:prepilin-type processing-associated H-X9-DG protein